MAFRALSEHSLKEQFKTLCHLMVFGRDELIFRRAISKCQCNSKSLCKSVLKGVENSAFALRENNTTQIF